MKMAHQHQRNEMGKDRRPWLSVAIAAATLILIFAAVKALAGVLKPIAFAFILTVLLSPAVKFLSSKLRLPKTLSIALTMAFTIVLFACTATFVNSLVTSFAKKYADYSVKFEMFIRHLHSVMPPEAMEMIKGFNWQAPLAKTVSSLSSSLISTISATVMVLIITAFMLLEQRDLKLKIDRAFPRPGHVDRVLGVISSQISRYLIIHSLISLATALLAWLALSLLKVDFAATWAVLTFILNFIPTIGSILATIPPVLIALVQYSPDTVMPALFALLSLLAIQFTLGNVIEPNLAGDKLGLSPVAILISLLLWGWLWGVAGALLATPIAASMKIVFDNIEPLRPIGTLLGSARSIRKEQNG